jgi:hypothetical protein
MMIVSLIEFPFGFLLPVVDLGLQLWSGQRSDREETPVPDSDSV